MQQTVGRAERGLHHRHDEVTTVRRAKPDTRTTESGSDRADLRSYRKPPSHDTDVQTDIFRSEAMRYRRLRVEGGVYFFTLVTFGRAPILRDPMIASLFYQAMSHVRRYRPFVLDAHVVMPDHVHLLMTLPADDSDFTTRLMLIKTGFTRRHLADKGGAHGYRRQQRRERAVWQGRYWEHLISDDAEFDAIADYIHYNPVAHGLVQKPSDWLESSFAQWVADGRRDALWGSGETPRLPSMGGEP